MDATFWEIEQIVSGGLRKTFADWGIASSSAITLTRRSQATDTLSFTVDNLVVDATPPFAANEILRVYRNGAGWFAGRVTRISRSATPQNESFEYEVSGPWWYLENLPYEQEWNIATTPSNPNSPVAAQRKSRSILFQKLDGTRITTIQQIDDALAYAQSKGALFTIGLRSLPSVQPPFSEVKDQACSEVVRAALRWHPDAVSWFDYSVFPPALNFARRSACTPVSLPFTSQANAVQITPRHDLVVAGCKIIYEVVNSIDEVSWTQHTIDQAGVETFQSVVVTIELSGFSAAYQRQKLTATAQDPSTKAFWKSKLKWLQPALDADITITSPKVAGVAHTPGTFVNELTDGAMPFWLDSTTDEVEVTAEISYKLTNSVTNAQEVKERVPCVTTIKRTTVLAGTQTFARLASFTAAEPIPTGIAAAYHAAANQLHYDGQWSLLEDEVSGVVGIGNVLNLTGGPSEWTTMSALVQQVVEEIGSGQTTIVFGPGSHLSPQDFIELLRVQRGRTPSWRLQERVDGKAYGDTAQVEGATKTPKADSQAPGVPGKTLTLADVPATNPSKVILNTADIVAAVQALSDKDIKLRAFDVCENGVAKKVLLLASATYV